MLVLRLWEVRSQPAPGTTSPIVPPPKLAALRPAPSKQERSYTGPKVTAGVLCQGGGGPCWGSRGLGATGPRAGHGAQAQRDVL